MPLKYLKRLRHSWVLPEISLKLTVDLRTLCGNILQQPSIGPALVLATWWRTSQCTGGALQWQTEPVFAESWICLPNLGNFCRSKFGRSFFQIVRPKLWLKHALVDKWHTRNSTVRTVTSRPHREETTPKLCNEWIISIRVLSWFAHWDQALLFCQNSQSLLLSAFVTISLVEEEIVYLAIVSLGSGEGKVQIR